MQKRTEFGLKENTKMKTISQIAKMFDNGLIKRDEVYEIEVGDLVRIYKAHQRVLSDKVALEAKVASFEIVERKESNLRLI